MDSFRATPIISVAIAGVIASLITAGVTIGVRRAPTTQRWKATKAGVVLVVTSRRWQRVLLRVVGIVIALFGALLLLVFATDDDGDEGMGIAGAAMLVGGLVFVWLAHAMKRMRLELTPDVLYAFPMVGSPREVPVGELTALTPLQGNNFGGIVLYAGDRRVFAPNKTFSGYVDLIGYLRRVRPDLPVPEAALPF